VRGILGKTGLVSIPGSFISLSWYLGILVLGSWGFLAGRGLRVPPLQIRPLLRGIFDESYVAN
jgi:hypothetical protein